MPINPVRIVPPPPVPTGKIGISGFGTPPQPATGPGSPGFTPPAADSYPRVAPPPPVPTGYAVQPRGDSAPAMPFADQLHKTKVQRIRQTLIGGLDKQMAEAEKLGNFDQVRHVAAQYSALDNGGFAGLERYHQERADAQSQRDHMARQDNPMAGMSPEDLQLYTASRSGDMAAVAAAAQMKRIATAEAQAKAAGTPAQIAPQDAQAFLNSRHSDIAPLFASSDTGGAAMGDLSNIYTALVSRGTPGINDPQSPVSQAIKARVKQLYGDTLPDQVDEPFAPSHFAPAAGMDLAGSRVAAWLGNFFTGRGLHMSQAYHDNQLATGQWWKTINQTPAP